MDKPLRRFHLSTLLVMTLIGGGWMALNFREYDTVASVMVDINDYSEESVTKFVRTRGFPFQIHTARGVRAWHGPSDIYMSFDAMPFVMNCICGMFLMGGVGCLMEWWMEKRGGSFIATSRCNRESA